MRSVKSAFQSITKFNRMSRFIAFVLELNGIIIIITIITIYLSIGFFIGLLNTVMINKLNTLG